MIAFGVLMILLAINMAAFEAVAMHRIIVLNAGLLVKDVFDFTQIFHLFLAFCQKLLSSV